MHACMLPSACLPAYLPACLLLPACMPAGLPACEHEAPGPACLPACLQLLQRAASGELDEPVAGHMARHSLLLLQAQLHAVNVQLEPAEGSNNSPLSTAEEMDMTEMAWGVEARTRGEGTCDGGDGDRRGPHSRQWGKEEGGGHGPQWGRDKSAGDGFQGQRWTDEQNLQQGVQDVGDGQSIVHDQPRGSHATAPRGPRATAPPSHSHYSHPPAAHLHAARTPPRTRLHTDLQPRLYQQGPLAHPMHPPTWPPGEADTMQPGGHAVPQGGMDLDLDLGMGADQQAPPAHWLTPEDAWDADPRLQGARQGAPGQGGFGGAGPGPGAQGQGCRGAGSGAQWQEYGGAGPGAQRPVYGGPGSGLGDGGRGYMGTGPGPAGQGPLVAPWLGRDAPAGAQPTLASGVAASVSAVVATWAQWDAAGGGPRGGGRRPLQQQQQQGWPAGGAGGSGASVGGGGEGGWGGWGEGAAAGARGGAAAPQVVPLKVKTVAQGRKKAQASAGAGAAYYSILQIK